LAIFPWPNILTIKTKQKNKEKATNETRPAAARVAWFSNGEPAIFCGFLQQCVCKHKLLLGLTQI
jgi:hypothetical protein